MTTADLNPAQRRVLTDLMGTGQPRPRFHPDLGTELRAWLEGALDPVAATLEPGQSLMVAKRDLGNVHACETYWSVERDNFEWNARTARGTVAHKAIEASIFRTDDPAPLDLVDEVMAAFLHDDHRTSPGRWLSTASHAEKAELRSGANHALTAFQEGWPRIPSRWRPRCEKPLAVKICDGRIVLQGKPDLMLGRADGAVSQALIVDVKTGRAHASHVDDGRFYALLHTLQLGIPPFRVASYYLDSAEFHYEDMTAELLETAVRRTIDGATAIARIRTIEAPDQPSISPGPVCAWCRARTSCPGPAQLVDDLDLPVV